MTRIWLSVLLSLMFISSLHASQSTITEAEGYSCMGADKSRIETEQTAMANAKRSAVEKATTYIQSETHVKDFQFEKDLIAAYANATVKVVEELEKGWYTDPSCGDCFKVKIRAEVVPDEKAIERASNQKSVISDPSAPLSVQVWTDKGEYGQGEKIKVYMKGNKPFYARVVYRDASGNMVQLLPNPYRTENYFHGGVIYEIPSGQDRFELEVAPPFGQEDILVYAGTTQLGDIDLEARGSVYGVRTAPANIGSKTRGVKIKEKGSGKIATASEFFEQKVAIETGK